jgi:hypothetical protein
MLAAALLIQSNSGSLSISIKSLLIGVAALLLVGGAVSQFRRNSTQSFNLTLFSFFGLGVILLLVDIPYIDRNFTHSLADALIIASILAFTVDLYLKERVLREVSSDVSKYLVGYRLPEEIQNRIRSLLQTRWIRRNCRIRLRLTESPDNAGQVRVEIVVSREVENITTEEDSFQDKFSYERHLPQNLTEMRCDSADPKAQYQIRGAGLAREKNDEPGVMEAAGSVVKIPPVHEMAGRYYQFTVRYTADYPENYSDIYTFELPTIGVIFEAECPREFRVTVPPADISTPNRWEYRKLFLPGEHIRYRWERIADPANQEH